MHGLEACKADVRHARAMSCEVTVLASWRAPSHSSRTLPIQASRQRSSTVLIRKPEAPTMTHSFTCALCCGVRQAAEPQAWYAALECTI